MFAPIVCMHCEIYSDVFFHDLIPKRQESEVLLLMPRHLRFLRHFFLNFHANAIRNYVVKRRSPAGH